MLAVEWRACMSPWESCNVARSRTKEDTYKKNLPRQLSTAWLLGQVSAKRKETATNQPKTKYLCCERKLFVRYKAVHTVIYRTPTVLMCADLIQGKIA